MSNQIIVAKIQGGLGNQMFQYANAYAFSKQHNKVLKLDLSFYNEQRSEQDTPRFYELEQFGISTSAATNEEINLSKVPLSNLLS